MLRQTILLGIFTGGCALLPAFYELNPGAIERWYASIRADTADPAGTELPTQMAPVAAAPLPIAAEPLPGRKVLIRSDPSGHFVAEFKLNGRQTEALVDTGATVVAINRSTARRIGISVAGADFRHEVQTANGVTRAAAATIDRIQIGRISVEGVPAIVLDDAALDGALVGMSFLNRLSNFQMQGGALVMQQ